MTWEQVAANTVGTIFMEAALLVLFVCLLMPQHAALRARSWRNLGLGVRLRRRGAVLLVLNLEVVFSLPETFTSCPESCLGLCLPECEWCKGTGWLNPADLRRLSQASEEERHAAHLKVAPWLMDASEEPLADLDGSGQK